MKRITTGARITRSPGATVHVAASEGRDAWSGMGWLAMCGRIVYHPSADPAHLTGPRCETCKALEKA